MLVDAALSAGGANPRLLAEIDRAGPFGAGSPEPVFVFPAHRLTDVIEIGSGGHVRVKLRSGDGANVGGIAFRVAQEPLGRALLAARGETVHLAATLTLNRWGGDGDRRVAGAGHGPRRPEGGTTAIDPAFLGKLALADGRPCHYTSPRFAMDRLPAQKRATFVYRLGHQPFTLGRRVRLP